MLLAWRGFHGFETGTNARAWLFRILFNVFHGAGRKARSGDRFRLRIASMPDLQEAVEISEALDALSFEQRTVLLLCCSGRIHLPGDRGNPGTCRSGP